MGHLRADLKNGAYGFQAHADEQCEDELARRGSGSIARESELVAEKHRIAKQRTDERSPAKRGCLGGILLDEVRGAST